MRRPAFPARRWSALALAAALPLAGCTRWQPVAPPGGGFEIQMPLDAPCNRTRLPEIAGELTGWSCAGTTGSRSPRFALFRATSIPLPADSDPQEIERRVIESLTRKAVFRDTRVSPLGRVEIAGLTWLEVSIEVRASETPFRARELLLVRPDALYELRVEGPADRWPRPEARRFFESFRLLDVRESGPG